jgi:hypothetical protein
MVWPDRSPSGFGKPAVSRRWLARYQWQRDQALEEIFGVTCRLAAYPRYRSSSSCKRVSAPRSTRRQRRWPTEINDSMHNGVDTATLFATLDAVKEVPEAAAFQFRAHNQWVSGTHNRTTIADYFGVGEEHAHERTFTFDADHPAVLWARTTDRLPWSSCCTRWQPALPPGWPTSPPPAGCG